MYSLFLKLSVGGYRQSLFHPSSTISTSITQNKPLRRLTNRDIALQTDSTRETVCAQHFEAESIRVF